DLPEPVVIYLLMSELEAADLPRYITGTIGVEGLDLVALLEKYTALSAGKVTLRYLDPTLNPDIRERFGVGNISQGDLLIEGPGRVKHILFSDLFNVSDQGVQGYRAEQALTGAILYAIAEFVPVAVFAEGHGMLSPEPSYNGASLSMMRELLEKSGFSTRTQNLALEDIAEDARLLVIAAPTTDFTQEEIARADEFLKSGGSVLYLTGNERNANLGGWLAEWGVQIEDYIIMDEVQRIGDPRFVVPLLNAHDMFNSVGSHSLPLLQIPRALHLPFAERGGLTVQGVLATSQYSYGRLIGSENTEIDRAAEDVSGPFVVGAVSHSRTYDRNTAQATDAYLVVLPHTLCFDIILSYYAYLNNDMTGAAVRYLTPADLSSGLVIPSKALSSPLLTLTGMPSLITGIFLVGVLPPGIFVTGLVFWRKRRKK
ncbi:MAG: GldG family protein, partial [Oscillospiraceae bacterium]|nr:GldG family protein [Oscillospiraceae bacterium]